MTIGLDRFSASFLMFDVRHRQLTVVTTKGREALDDPVYCLFLHVVLVGDTRHRLGLGNKSSQREEIWPEALGEIDIEAILSLALRKLPNGDFYRRRLALFRCL